jgi:hypothetical protein
MNKILAIIFTVLFAFNVFLCVKSITDSGKGQDALADAVFIKDGVVDEANEGKLVVVTGPITVSAEAYDEETELTLESALAAKHTETLRTVYFDKETNNNVVVPETGLSPLEFNEKYRTEEQWSPELDEYVYGAAWIGDFYITEEVLIPLLGSKELGIETFWQDELDESPYYYYFEGDDIYFSLADPDNFVDGDQRVSYRGININEDTTYTIVGTQKSKYLYKPEVSLGEWIFEGEKSSSELTSNTAKNGVMAAVFFGVLSLVFLALALWKFEIFDKLFNKNQ